MCTGKGLPYSIYHRYLRSQLCSQLPQGQRLEDERVPSHIVPDVLEEMESSDLEQKTGSLLDSQEIARLKYRSHDSSVQFVVCPEISTHLAAKF